MTLAEYDTFCAALAQTEKVVQWGGAHVWKVGGKVFAIASLHDSAPLAITFKTSDIVYHVLKDEPGLRPAPYLASRGIKWIQHYGSPGLDDEGLKVHIHASYRMAIDRLTQKKRDEFGLAKAKVK